jgi:hypothetical protein
MKMVLPSGSAPKRRNHTSGLPRLPENLQLKEMTNPYSDYGKTEIKEYLRSIKAKIAVVVLSNVFEINDKIDALAYSLASTDKK